jgi:hypothetical protein
MSKKAINVVCPSNNKNERQYIIEQMCNFIGVVPKIRFSKDVKNYELVYMGKKLVIEDHFFNKFKKKLDYYKAKNVSGNSFNYLNLVGIYGRKFRKDDDDKIILGIDIFASAFFMLTRWEEMVLPKAENSKPLEKDLLAIKDNFYNRPIVDEYCDFICSLLVIKRSKIQPKIMITHDVDWVYLSPVKDLIKNLFTIAAERQFERAFRIMRNYIIYKITRRNPFDSFEEMINLSDKYGFKDHFYFKGMKNDDKNATYNIDDKRVIKKIKFILRSGHHVGIHPSENSFGSNLIFAQEAGRLLRHTRKIIGGRQHKLLVSDEIFRNYEKFKIPYDSSYGFQHVNGFRCGTCQPFDIFDISHRKQLGVKEIPFEIMDSVLFRTKNIKEFTNSSKRIIDEVLQRGGGVLVLNWHSNMLNMIEMKEYKTCYNIILEHINYEMDKTR